MLLRAALLLLAVLPLSASPSAEDTLSYKPLRIGLMPAVDSVPIIVAESEGYFSDEGLTVELEVFRNQLNREAALQAGSIDATVSDLVNAIRSWENGADYKVLTSTQGIFSLLVAPSSRVYGPDSWPTAPATVPTGLLEDSIIYFTAVRMMEDAGLDPATLEIIPTLQIPVRVELLLAGELEAAVLPEPVTRLATAGGARVIVDSRRLSWTPGIVIATGRALDEKPREIEAFLRAYDRAVESVNANPDSYRNVIVERAALPPPVTESMILPHYEKAAVPAPDVVRDVAVWMQRQGLITDPPAHGDIVAQRPIVP